MRGMPRPTACVAPCCAGDGNDAERVIGKRQRFVSRSAWRVVQQQRQQPARREPQQQQPDEREQQYRVPCRRSPWTPRGGHEEPARPAWVVQAHAAVPCSGTTRSSGVPADWRAGEEEGLAVASNRKAKGAARPLSFHGQDSPSVADGGPLTASKSAAASACVRAIHPA